MLSPYIHTLCYRIGLEDETEAVMTEAELWQELQDLDLITEVPEYTHYLKTLYQTQAYSESPARTMHVLDTDELSKQTNSVWTTATHAKNTAIQKVLQKRNTWELFMDAAYYAQNLSLTCTYEPLSVNAWDTHCADIWECLHREIRYVEIQLLQHLQSPITDMDPLNLSLTNIKQLVQCLSVHPDLTVSILGNVRARRDFLKQYTPPSV